MKDGLDITCKEHSVASFMALFMHFPGGNKEEQANSVITVNLDAVKENFLVALSVNNTVTKH
jgi:hypothetical protein